MWEEEEEKEGPCAQRPQRGANSVEVPSKGKPGSHPLVLLHHRPSPTGLSQLRVGIGGGLGYSFSQPPSVHAPQALEEMKGDDVIAVEKSLESGAWAQLWTLRITVSVGTKEGWAEERVKGHPVSTSVR